MTDLHLLEDETGGCGRPFLSTLLSYSSTSFCSGAVTTLTPYSKGKEEDEERGGVKFGRRADRKCQYAGLMFEVAGAVLTGAVLGFHYESKVEVWIEGEQEKMGL